MLPSDRGAVAERCFAARRDGSPPSPTQLSSPQELDASTASPGALVLPSVGLGRSGPEKSAEPKCPRMPRLPIHPAGSAADTVHSIEWTFRGRPSSSIHSRPVAKPQVDWG